MSGLNEVRWGRHLTTLKGGNLAILLQVEQEGRSLGPQLLAVAIALVDSPLGQDFASSTNWRPMRRVAKLSTISSLLLVRQIAEGIAVADRCAYPQIVVRQHVQSAERENQEHLSGPNINALTFVNSPITSPVRHPPDALQLHFTVANLAGQIQEMCSPSD